MQSNPPCPVCHSLLWQAVGTRTYRLKEEGKASQYVRKRLEVLFQVWFPGISEVTISSVLCKQCGFVCYTPRPDEDDIKRKYAFLSDDAATGNEISQRLASDKLRSRDLYQRVRSYLRSGASVLDFGGGNGRLMPAFMQHGHHCHLIDYSSNVIPGVRYLGNQLSDIQPVRNFDLIVCSHILEHLADPGSVVHALRAYLSATGVLYVEVPLEIWNKAPLPEEPVTHINYFTVDSLRIMLERADLDVLSCEEGMYTTENGSPGLALRAIAKRGEDTVASIRYEGSPEASLRLIQPGLLQRFSRAFKYPLLACREIRRTIHQRLSRMPLLWRLF